MYLVRMLPDRSDQTFRTRSDFGLGEHPLPPPILFDRPLHRIIWPVGRPLQ